jgi:hypothetical protein
MPLRAFGYSLRVLALGLDDRERVIKPSIDLLGCFLRGRVLEVRILPGPLYLFLRAHPSYRRFPCKPRRVESTRVGRDEARIGSPAA